MSLLGRLFGKRESNLKNVIDDYSEELNLVKAADRLESELDNLIKKEIMMFDKDKALHLSGIVKSMMNEKSISKKLDILGNIRNILSETQKKDMFSRILYELEQNYHKQHSKILHALDELKLCPTA